MLAYSALAVGVGIRRTTDETFRSHAKWLGYLIAASLIATILSLVLSILTQTPVEPYFSAIVGAYFFYRMAKALAPLNRISIEDSAKN